MQLKTVFTVLFALVPLAASTGVHTGGNKCEKGNFWYSDGKCCLPKGGPPKPPPPPPKDHECPPTSYYWDKKKSCCVPRNPPPPNPPPPQCPKKWTWYPNLRFCLPTPHPPKPPTPQPSPKPPHGYPPHNPPKPPHGWPPKPPHGPHNPPKPPHNPPKPPHGFPPYNPPSYPGHPGHGGGHGGWGKRAHAMKRSNPCPQGLDACPISSLSGEYECLDTSSELESCGGCTSQGKGQDCTKIDGAWNVGCEQGACVVYTCAGGFKIGDDGKTCISVSE